jgi:hypothetical protein
MRAIKAHRPLLLIGLLVVVYPSCRAFRDGGQQTLTPGAQGDSVEDSGKKLSGEFRLIPVVDDYRAGKPSGEAEVEFAFDASGGFKKRWPSRGAETILEEGTYLISTAGELVIYVEKSAGEQLDAARVERYRIEEESGDRLKLAAGAAGHLALERK